MEAFAQRLINLIEEERQAGHLEASKLRAGCSVSQLQKRGILLNALRISGIKSGLGGKTIVDFEPGTGGMVFLPTHKFGIGDAVLLEDAAARKQSAQTSLVGIVTRISDTVISIAFKQETPDWPQSCRLSQLANDVSYSRMHDAMRTLLVPQLTNDLYTVLIGEAKPLFNDTKKAISFFNAGLNQSQQDAVNHALHSHHVALIHGPPGTGKTYTCVEILHQLAERNQKVLVCGPSNISVGTCALTKDNLVERLAKSKLDIVRLGHPARILESVRDHALDIRIKSSEEGQIVNDMRREIDMKLKSVLKTKSKSQRRPLYEDIKHLRKDV